MKQYYHLFYMTVKSNWETNPYKNFNFYNG